MPKPKPASDFDFDQTMSELEEVVVYLESGNVNLDESLQKFEVAIQKAEQLKQHLKSAELRIQTLKQQFDTDQSS